jgi:hypothetical protein
MADRQTLPGEISKLQQQIDARSENVQHVAYAIENSPRGQEVGTALVDPNSTPVQVSNLEKDAIQYSKSADQINVVNDELAKVQSRLEDFPVGSRNYNTLLASQAALQGEVARLESQQAVNVSNMNAVLGQEPMPMRLGQAMGIEGGNPQSRLGEISPTLGAAANYVEAAGRSVSSFLHGIADYTGSSLGLNPTVNGLVNPASWVAGTWDGLATLTNTATFGYVNLESADRLGAEARYTVADSVASHAIDAFAVGTAAHFGYTRLAGSLEGSAIGEIAGRDIAAGEGATGRVVAFESNAVAPRDFVAANDNPGGATGARNAQVFDAASLSERPSGTAIAANDNARTFTAANDNPAGGGNPSGNGGGAPRTSVNDGSIAGRPVESIGTPANSNSPTASLVHGNLALKPAEVAPPVESPAYNPNQYTTPPAAANQNAPRTVFDSPIYNPNQYTTPPPPLSIARF